MYHGLGKQSVGVVQFDTTKNRFLAAGDEFVIKFWDMDNNNLLTTTDAEGGLPVIMELHLFKYLFPSFLTHGLLQANNSVIKCLRLHLAFGSVRKEYFWLSQQVRTVSRFLQMVTVLGLCTPLKVVHSILLEFFLALLQR